MPVTSGVMILADGGQKRRKNGLDHLINLKDQGLS